MDWIEIGKTILGIVIMAGGFGFVLFLFIDMHNVTQELMHPKIDKKVSRFMRTIRCEVCNKKDFINFEIVGDNPPFDSLFFCEEHEPIFLEDVSVDWFYRFKSRLGFVMKKEVR